MSSYTVMLITQAIAVLNAVWRTRCVASVGFQTTMRVGFSSGVSAGCSALISSSANRKHDLWHHAGEGVRESGEL